MSHFNVAVILDGETSLDDLLAPYCENTDNPEFLEFFDIQDEYEKKFNTETMDAIQAQDGVWHTPFDDCFKTQTTEQFYENSLTGSGPRCWWEKDANGNKVFFYYSHEGCATSERPISELFENFDAYIDYVGYRRDESQGRYGWWGNPNAKWDWYLVGGRWKGMLKASCGENGQPSFVSPVKNKIGYYDIARIGDVDFSPDQDAYQRAIRFWEVVVEEQPLRENENKEDFFSLCKKEYYFEYYKTKEQYARECSEFSTFAVVTNDGEWHEKGTMGWFGMSSETGEESRQWHNSWFDTFIKNADPDWRIAIVDCHI